MPWGRVGRVALWVVGGLFGLIVVVVAGAIAVLNTHAGATKVASVVSALASAPGSTTQIGQIGLSGIRQISIRDIALSDRAGEWAHIDRAIVIWRPGALLGAKVDIESLLVESVRIARKPLPSPETKPSQSGFSLPHLPPIRVRTLQIQPVELAAPVLGEAMALRAEGAFGVAQNQTIRTHATINRTDRPSRIALDATYRPDRPALDLRFDIDEAQGGFVSRLAQLPGSPAITLRVTGSGQLDDWHGALQADLTDLAQMQGEVSGALAGSGALSAQMAAHFGPLMPNAIVQAIGNSAELGLAATRGDSGEIAIDRFGLTAPNVAVTAHGSVNTSSGRIDGLDIGARVPDGARLQALLGTTRIGAAELNLHLEGPFAAPRTKVTAEAKDVFVDGLGTLPQLAAKADLVAPVGQDAPDTVPIALTAKAGNPDLQQTALEALVGSGLDLGGKATWQRKSGLIDIGALTVRGEFLKLSGSGRYGLSSKDVRADLSLTVDRLHAAAPGASGHADAKLKVAGNLLGDLGADISARAEDLAYPPIPALAVLGAAPSIEVHAARKADGSIHIAQMHVQGSDLVLHASRCEIAESVSCQVEGRLASLQPLSGTAGIELAGSLTLKIDAQGTRAAPKIALSLIARDGRIGAAKFNALTAEGNVGDVTGNPNGRLTLRLDAPAGSAQLATGFALTQNRSSLKLSDLRATGPGIAARGTLTAQLKQKLASGAIDLEVSDAGKAAALAGMTAQGTAKVHVVLADAQGHQALTATVHAQDLSLRTGAGTRYRIASADLRADGHDLLGAAATLNANLRGSDFAGPGLALDSVTASAAGPLTQLRIQAALAGRMDRATGPQALTLALNGQLERSPKETGLRLDRLGGKAAGVDFVLRRPARIALAGGQTRIEGLALGLDSGTVTVSATYRTDAVSADIAVRALPANIFSAVRPTADFDGRIDGTARVQARPGGGSGHVALQFAGLRPREVGAQRTTVDAIPALSGRLDGDWDGRRAMLNGRVTGLSRTAVSLRANVPLAPPANSAIPALIRTAPVSAHLDWNGPVGPLWALLPLVEHRLNGDANVVADVGGTIAAPRVAGTARLSNGRYEHLIWGTVLDRLTVTAQVQSSQSAVVSLSATDGGHGTMRGRASVGLASADHPIDAAVDMSNFMAVRRDDATGAIDAHITAAGPAKSARIAGRVTTGKIETLLTANLPPSVVTLDVRQVNGPPPSAGAPPPPPAGTIRVRAPVVQQAAAEQPAAGAPPALPATPSAAMPLDVKIHVPHSLYVRGRGLDSEWKGDLRIGGTSAAPRIFGALQLVRGDISLAGKTIALDNTSTITFAGTTTIDPALNLTATITATNVTATLTVTGRASEPKIALSSTPALPQDEVLAQVLFGKSTASLSPFEAVQLASAVADLSGLTGSGPGFMGRMRTSLGLDVLRLQSNEAGQTTLGAGKYIGQHVYLGVQQGAQANSGQVTVNIDITKHLSVETDVGAASNSRAGVNWKYDY